MYVINYVINNVCYKQISHTYIKPTSRCNRPTDFSFMCLLKVYLIQNRFDANIFNNNSENFIDHKLLDAEGILKKYQTLIFAKKWAWPCHAP